MELLGELLQIIVFFTAFKYKGLMFATIAIILFALAKLIIVKISSGKFKAMQLISFGCLLILGGISLIFKQEIFIKWKLTVVYWILAAAFLIGHIFGKKPIIERLNNNLIELPPKVWNLLSILWMMFFVFMGILNLYIVYCFDTNTWVNFKLFGTFGIMLIFVLLQAIFIYKFAKYKHH